MRSGLNSIIDLWNGFGVHLPEVVLFEGFGRRDTFGPIDFELPDIPHLAGGGIVRASSGGTLALLGEGGRDEAVVPLGRDHDLGGAGLGLGGGVVNEVHIHVNGSLLMDKRSLGQTIIEAIQAAEARTGRQWRTARR